MFYETLDDITADAGIRVKAKSLEELFCKVLLATFNEITDLELVQEKEEKSLEVKGKLPFLIADTVNASLLLHEKERFVPKGCEVIELREDSVRLKLRGERFDPKRHTSKLLIKAATYHRLKLANVNSQYVAEVIFDI